MTTIIFPPTVKHEDLAKAMRTLGLAIGGEPVGWYAEAAETVFRAKPIVGASCSSEGCARPSTIIQDGTPLCSAHALDALKMRAYG